MNSFFCCLSNFNTIIGDFVYKRQQSQSKFKPAIQNIFVYKRTFFPGELPPPPLITIELMSLTYIDNTRLKLLQFVRWMDGKICCIKMALSYCITPGILLHVLHGPTYTLNINVQVYQSHFKLLRSLQILSISFTLRGPGEKDLLHMKYWLWYYQGRIYVPGTINKIL